MGYYIEGPARGKASFLVGTYGAIRTPKHECEQHLLSAQHNGGVDILNGAKAVVCVVDNGIFDAAGYAFNYEEFKAFTLPSDPRPKEFLLMDKAKVHELTGYRERR